MSAPPVVPTAADSATGGTWRAPAAEVAAALAAPCLLPLADLGLIEVAGEDAAQFLHGQLTNRAEALPADAFQLSGYCNPKGRLIATFRHWRDGERHYLLLPRELAPAVGRRLAMFVLRAKAKVTDVSAGFVVLGALGTGVESALATAVAPQPVPGEAWRHAGTIGDGVVIGRVPGSARAPARFLLVASTARAAALRSGWSAAGGREGVAAAWWWTEIDGGLPTVFAATQEHFVPQMINLEVLGGVDFRKGCYPGQEVVARSQYRGALRRRLRIAHGAGASAGEDVRSAAADEPIGSIVMAASAPDGGMDVLLEAPTDGADGSWRNAAGEVLVARPLPYPITDPTA